MLMDLKVSDTDGIRFGRNADINGKNGHSNELG